MKINEILLKEKRRNANYPEQKVKTSYEQLLPYHNEDNIYINFTNISKAGVNPTLEHETPLGIYTYPLKEIWKYIEKEKNIGNVPFAGDRKYINIFKSNQVMELSNYHDNDLKTDIIKLKAFLKERNFKDKNISNIIAEGKTNSFTKNPGGYLWNITRLISIELNENNSQYAWNWIFRNILGYKAISDKKGQGIIHPNEETQAVFFDVTAFKLIGRIRNKIDSLSPIFSKYKDLNLKSEKEQINILKKYPYLFYKIKNPSEKVQSVAVNKDGNTIKYINNPSEKLQIAAINQNWSSIRYIKNLSEKLQIIAVLRNQKAIKYIKNPSEKIQLVAVNRNGHAIRFIENPSENVQLAAVNKSGYAVEYIKNPSEKVQLAAVNESGYAIEHIKNPSEKVQLAAVNESGYAVGYIKNPSEKVQLVAIMNNWKTIYNIRPESAITDKVRRLAEKLKNENK